MYQLDSYHICRMMMIEAYKFSVLCTRSAYYQKNPINYHLRVKRGNTEYNAAPSLTESHCLYIFFFLYCRILCIIIKEFQNLNSNVLHYSSDLSTTGIYMPDVWWNDVKSVNYLAVLACSKDDAMISTCWYSCLCPCLHWVSTGVYE